MENYIAQGQSVTMGLIIKVQSTINTLAKECLKTLSDDGHSDSLELKCIELSQTNEFQNAINHQNVIKFFQNEWKVIYPIYLKSLEIMSEQDTSANPKIPQWVRNNAK